MSNKARVEKILGHLEYSAEMTAEILAKFPTRKGKEKEGADDGEESDLEQEMCEDLRGEAEMLNHLINKLSEKPKEGNFGSQGKNQQKASASSAEVWEPLKEKPEKDEVNLPPGCTLHVRLPLNASPSIQGFLPEGETYKNHKSHSRSFTVSGAAGSASSKPRAAITKDQATAQVVAWLWGWWDSSQPERAGKKTRRS